MGGLPPLGPAPFQALQPNARQAVLHKIRSTLSTAFPSMCRYVSNRTTATQFTWTLHNSTRQGTYKRLRGTAKTVQTTVHREVPGSLPRAVYVEYEVTRAATFRQI